MLFPIEHVLEGRDLPVCALGNWTVKDALDRMIEHDYSQLPVVDDSGKQLGLITERQIVRLHYNFKGESVLDFSVAQCRTNATVLTKEDDFLEALEPLNRVDSVIVVDDEYKPVGILTHYDATLFFREFSEGLMLVQDIEMTVRDLIRSVFPNGDVSNATLYHAIGGNRQNPAKPAKQFDELTLSEYIQVITSEKNWPQFEDIFKPKTAFNALMQPVREIRNQIMHFRDNITRVQLDTLKRAQTWLNNYPRPTTSPKPELAVVDAMLAWHASDSQHHTDSVETTLTWEVRDELHNTDTWEAVLITDNTKRGKYYPLARWLSTHDQVETQLRVAFGDIEKLLGQSLPPFAEHRSWWANVKVGRSQSTAWLGAGWRVKEVDMNAREVTFQRIPQSDHAEEDEGEL